MKSKPFPFQEVSYLLIHFTVCNLDWLLLLFTAFPFWREDHVIGKCVHSQPTALLQLAAALCSRKWEGFLSVPVRKVYNLENSMNRKALPPHNVSDTEFCPSVGAVMWKIENLYRLTPWVCFTSGKPKANKTCLKMEVYVLWGESKKNDTFFHINIFTIFNKLFSGFMKNKEWPC